MISEVCVCGASVVVQGALQEVAAIYIWEWRLAHICPARHELSEKLGYDLLSHKTAAQPSDSTRPERKP